MLNCARNHRGTATKAAMPVVLLCLFFVTLCLGFAEPSLAAGTAAAARQCVVQAGNAVDSADATAFEKLVDVDGILAKALDIFVRQAKQPEVAAEMPPMLAILFAQAGSGEQGSATVRAVLLSESRAFIVNGISSGAFAGRKVDGRASQGVLAPLFADASTGRKEIRQVGEARAKNGDWLVPFTVYDHGNGESYRVTGRVSFDGNSTGRLVAVENLEALMGQVADESRSIQ
ncbi:MAG: hypothetical protein PHI96_04915 [Desulfovibrio sp.]|nr:hypothetical protein [Desulfovibrio sp.]